MKKILALVVVLASVSSFAMAGMSVVGNFSGTQTMTHGMRMGLSGPLSVQVDVGPLLNGTTVASVGQVSVGYEVKSSADSACTLWAAVNVSNLNSTMTNSYLLNASHEVWLNKKLAIGVMGNLVNIGTTTTLFKGSSVYAVVALD